MTLSPSSSARTTRSGIVLPSLYVGRVPTPSFVATETTFQAGHGFAPAAGSTGTEADDLATYVAGSQSLRLTTPGTGGFEATRATGLAALDATGMHLALTCMVDQPALLSSLRLDVSSDAFANWSSADTISPSTNVGSPWYVPMQWVTVVIPWGAFAVGGGGGATRNALTGFQVRAQDTAGGAVKVWVNRIATVRAAAQAFVTFGLDDGWIGQYTYGLPILRAAGMAASFAPVVELCTTGNPSFITPANMLELQNAGWEPCVHANAASVHTNYPTLPDATVLADALAAQQWMVANGLGPATNFIIPEGSITSNERASTWDQWFALSRSAYTRVRETWPPARRTGLRSYTLSQAHLPADVESKVDEAVANGEWLIFEGHNFVTSAPVQTDYLVSDLQTVVSYIAGLGVPVRTFAQVAAGLTP